MVEEMPCLQVPKGLNEILEQVVHKKPNEKKEKFMKGYNFNDYRT